MDVLRLTICFRLIRELDGCLNWEDTRFFGGTLGSSAKFKFVKGWCICFKDEGDEDITQD